MLQSYLVFGFLSNFGYPGPVGSVFCWGVSLLTEPDLKKKNQTFRESDNLSKTKLS